MRRPLLYPFCFDLLQIARGQRITLLIYVRFRKQDQIDKKTLEIKQADEDVYTDLDSIAEELPDHMPRFILLSYPLTLV